MLVSTQCFFYNSAGQFYQANNTGEQMSIVVKGIYTIEDALIIPINNQSKCLPEMSFYLKKKFIMEVSAHKIVILCKKKKPENSYCLTYSNSFKSLYCILILIYMSSWIFFLFFVENGVLNNRTCTKTLQWTNTFQHLILL